MRLHVALMGALAAAAYCGMAAAADPSPDDFAYGLKIVTPGEAAAYRASLPLAVYQKIVRADLGDLRVFNGRGEVVPYALERPRSETTVEKTASSLPLFALRGDANKALDAVRVTIESGATTINLRGPAAGAPTGKSEAQGAGIGPITSYVLDGRSLATSVAAFRIVWPDDAADFAGRLQAEASDDLGAWRPVVAAAPIANRRAGDARLIERRVEFPATRAKFWRLSWAGNAAPFEITSVFAESAQDRVDVERTTLAVVGVPAREGATDRRGDFEFDLGAQLPVDRVNIELPEQNSILEVSLFSRAKPQDAWRPITRSGFYRLRSAGADLANGAIAIAPDADRYWLARTDTRGGGLGSGKPQLRVGWIPHEIVFLARGGGPFMLAYGSGVAGGAAGSLASIPKSVEIQSASLGDPQRLGGDSRRVAAPAATSLLSKSALLWSVLAVGVAFLAFMAYRLAKELQ